MVPVRIAESVAIAAELENGAVGSYHFSGVAPWAPEDRIDLIGTRGWLSYDWGKDEVSGASGDATQTRPIPVPDELRRDWTAEADFIQAIRTGAAVEPSFADGVKYMEFTEAVYRSAESGRRVCAARRDRCHSGFQEREERRSPLRRPVRKGQVPDSGACQRLGHPRRACPDVPDDG